MSALFELAGKYKTLYEMLVEADEEETEVINDTLESVVGEIEVKGDGYVAVCNKLDMEIDACKKQVAYWQSELKLRENALKRLKDRLVMFLSMIGKKEISTGTHTIKLVGNGGKAPLRFTTDTATDIPLEKMSIEDVPKEYRKVVVTETIDTDKIRAMLDSGEQLDWVKYGERGSHLKIK